MVSNPASDLKRRCILDATRLLLVERGFLNVVLDDVARRAGVAKGTLFLYYKSKDELFRAAFADLAEQLGKSLDAAVSSGKRGRELLAAAVGAFLAHGERNRDFLSQFGAGSFPACGPRSTGRLIARMGENVRRMLHILRLCVRDGVIRRGNLEAAVFALFGLCRSSVFHRLITGRERSLKARTDFVLDIFLNGMGKKP